MTIIQIIVITYLAVFSMYFYSTLATELLGFRLLLSKARLSAVSAFSFMLSSTIYLIISPFSVLWYWFTFELGYLKGLLNMSVRNIEMQEKWDEEETTNYEDSGINEK